MKTLLKNGISFYPPSYEVKPINILIEDTEIIQVSENKIEAAPDMIVYDLNGNLIVPGFMDCHTHLAQSFGRGIYDNLHLTQWLLTMGRHFDLTREQTYAATQLACIEAIKSGTTFVGEMATAGAYDIECIQAIADSGLRADVCLAVGDFQEGDNAPPDMNADQILDLLRDLHKEWHGKNNGRITTRVSPVGLPACTEELMRGSRALANELGVGIHTHCCEGETETANSYDRFNCSEVEALERFGVLGPDCQLVHNIWLTEHDMDLMAEYKCSAITCPSTNTKITDGMPTVPGLYKRGVNIAIGCDGESSSGTYDMLQEVRLVALLAKVSTGDAAMVKAEEAYEMMTKNGRQAVGFDTKVGEIKPGFKADLTVINYPAPHLIDERRLMSNFIYSATGGDVLSVFVDGKPLMLERKLTQIDEEEVLDKITEIMRKADNLLP
ncbi:MAG: amidohydrolase family protein [Anaerolineae bacterium]|jgi:5-methylthioadenosine/S-adenosylhomocysteine deaminase|nr:amidohydrolase family protein [Anaerolineae bacterium]